MDSSHTRWLPDKFYFPLDPWGHDQKARQGNNSKNYRCGENPDLFFGCPPRWIWKCSWSRKKVSLAQCCTSLLTSLLMRFFYLSKKLGLPKKEWRPLSFRVRGHFARLVTLDKSPILLKRESVGQHSCLTEHFYLLDIVSRVIFI